MPAPRSTTSGFFRLGRYDRGAAATALWFSEVEEVRRGLARIPLDGADVLELAPGTGIWTELLVDRARHLTAVDASAEMVEENRRRLGDRAQSVEFILADLFTWRSDHEYDAVVFCFWISHVPDSHLAAFLTGVSSMVRRGGAVFFLDGLREPTSTADDHELPSSAEEVMVRRLDDGREFRIVKNFRETDVLAAHCRAADLDIDVHETATYFQYGAGTRL